MSYDLLVVCERRPDLAKLRGYLTELAVVAGVYGAPDNQLDVRISRLEEREGAFFVDAPVKLEPGDLPEFAGVVKQANWMVELTLPAYSTEDAKGPALAGAIFLARASKGVVIDPQTDGVVWPKPKPLFGRRRPKRPRSCPIDIVKLNWIAALPGGLEARAEAAAMACDQYLGALKAFLPEGLPTRFGCFEPLQGKGVEEFKRSWREPAERPHGGSLFFVGEGACLGGHVCFVVPWRSLESPKHALNCLHISVELDAARLQDAQAADRCAHALVQIAERLRATYAIAYLMRGYELVGNQLFARQGSEQDPQLTGSGWIGIPPAPGWLLWYRKSYSPKLVERLSEHGAADSGEGLWIRLSPLPAPLEALTALMPDLPSELTFSHPAPTLSGHNPGARPADFIPTCEQLI